MSEHDQATQHTSRSSDQTPPTPTTLITSYQRVQKILGEYAATTLLSTSVFLLILGLLWCLATSVGNAAKADTVITANRLLILLGVLCGWLAGLFASPFEHEKNEFAELRKAIYAFLTGYLVSKVDRFLEKTLFLNDNMPVVPAWGQAALFVSAFLDAALVTFLWRRYGLVERKVGGG
jgi:hypothetical protein